MDIVSRLRDTTTFIKDHTKWAHLGCVSLRTFLGLAILTGKLHSRYLIPFGIFVALLFLWKFVKVGSSWKVYLRTVIVYLLVSVLKYIDTPASQTASGVLVITDALLGLQSRYTATLIT